jgi:hypothetical protein
VPVQISAAVGVSRSTLDLGRLAVSTWISWAGAAPGVMVEVDDEVEAEVEADPGDCRRAASPSQPTPAPTAPRDADEARGALQEAVRVAKAA